MISSTTDARLVCLANAGVVVSLAYGPYGDKGIAWTVQALHGIRTFDKPFLAKSFDHAIQIAETECIARGWVSYNTEDK